MPPTLRRYETQWQARLGPELRAGLAFRTLAARFDDRAIDALLELAAVDGIVPLLRRTANFNWHRAAALALLRNPGFQADRAVESLELVSGIPKRITPDSKSQLARRSVGTMARVVRLGWCAFQRVADDRLGVRIGVGS